MNKIILSPSKSSILIDTSYYVFYRYFSTLRWFKYKSPDVDIPSIDKNDEFIKAFYKHINNDLKKLCKRWDSKHSNILLCCDCSRETIWRNDLHDCYKGKRVVNTEFNPNIFEIFFEYIETKMNEWGINIINLDQLEADDIVFLTKQSLVKNEWNNKIVIITNDNDYLQLLDENTHIHNMNNKNSDLSKRSCGIPEKDLLIKILIGDKSDNISPIRRGVGIKTAKKLIELSDEDFNKYIDKYDCRDCFENNKKMIDFNEIPNDLQNKYNDLYTFEF